jgi:hypothetical protein
VAEQSSKRTESDLVAQDEAMQPPQIVEIEEPEMVSEQPQRVKRAKTEISDIPGPSSTEETWAPELRAGKRLITTQDSLLGTANADISSRIAHGLGATVCLPQDILAWNAMPTGKAVRQIVRGLFTISFGIQNTLVLSICFYFAIFVSLVFFTRLS